MDSSNNYFSGCVLVFVFMTRRLRRSSKDGIRIRLSEFQRVANNRLGRDQ